MAIDVACICGKRFRVKDEHAGKKGKCPACGKTVVIPRAEAVESPTEPDFVDPPPPARQKACPNCGAVISFFAKVCPECRASLTRPSSGNDRFAKSSPADANTTPGSPALGIALGLGTGLATAFAAAWAYAYVDLVFPLWSVLITLAFGAALGYVPSLAMVAGGLRDRRIGFPIVTVVVAFGYWLTWAVWVHAALNHHGDAPPVSDLMSRRSELSDCIGVIRDVGVWRTSGNSDPVHGGELVTIWLGEAILILGTALTAAWATLADDVPG